MVKVKICGLIRQEDIDAVNRYMPDYAGFVLAKGSRRSLNIEEAVYLSHRLANGILRVGVFADQSLDFIKTAISRCRLDVVQLHGHETPQFLKEISSVEVWKAIAVEGYDDLKDIKRWPADAVLLDGSKPGSGRPFRWDIAMDLGRYCRLVLAGGLNADNVRDAIETVKPYGVDVSSGVETEGRKDADKIRIFIETVRRIDIHGE